MKSKNPKTLTVFTISYVFAVFYLFWLFSLGMHEYLRDSSELAKFLYMGFMITFGMIFYIYIFTIFYAYIFKHFDATIEFIEKAWPYALLIVFLAFMLYAAIFPTD